MRVAVELKDVKPEAVALHYDELIEQGVRPSELYEYLPDGDLPNHLESLLDDDVNVYSIVSRMSPEDIDRCKVTLCARANPNAIDAMRDMARKRIDDANSWMGVSP